MSEKQIKILCSFYFKNLDVEKFMSLHMLIFFFFFEQYKCLSLSYQMVKVISGSSLFNVCPTERDSIPSRDEK